MEKKGGRYCKMNISLCCGWFLIRMFCFFYLTWHLHLVEASFTYDQQKVMSKFYVIQVLNTSINDNIGKLHVSAGKVSNIYIRMTIKAR